MGITYCIPLCWLGIKQVISDIFIHLLQGEAPCLIARLIYNLTKQGFWDIHRVILAHEWITFHKPTFFTGGPHLAKKPSSYSPFFWVNWCRSNTSFPPGGCVSLRNSFNAWSIAYVVRAPTRSWSTTGGGGSHRRYAFCARGRCENQGLNHGKKSWFIMAYHGLAGLSLFIMAHHGLSWSIMVFHGLT